MLWVQAHFLSFYTDVIRMCVYVFYASVSIWSVCTEWILYLMLSVVMAVAFHSVLSSSVSLIPCLSLHSTPVPSTGGGSLNPRLCPAGLPGNHGVVSSPWNLWGVVCANGHGAGHRLQQCARLRPQHWRRHGSERYHWCKWGWRAPPTSQSHQRFCLLFTSQSQRLRLMFTSQSCQTRLPAGVVSKIESTVTFTIV